LLENLAWQESGIKGTLVDVVEVDEEVVKVVVDDWVVEVDACGDAATNTRFINKKFSEKQDKTPGCEIVAE
jgi:hypothetical protein